MTTKTRIIQIGNSRGIRIPKVLLEHAQLRDEIELQSENGQLIVRAARKPREGWADAAKAMHAADDDKMIDAITSTRFDEEEWQW